MALSITHTPVYCLDLDETLAFYTERLGFEVREDTPAGPTMRWLTVAAPGADHELILAAIDQHIAAVDRDAMRELVVKGTLPVSPTASATAPSATPTATTSVSASRSPTRARLETRGEVIAERPLPTVRSATISACRSTSGHGA